MMVNIQLAVLHSQDQPERDRAPDLLNNVLKTLASENPKPCDLRLMRLLRFRAISAEAAVAAEIPVWVGTMIEL